MAMRQFHWHEIRRRKSEGGQQLVLSEANGFLPPQPPSFLPARAFSFCRAKRV